MPRHFLLRLMSRRWLQGAVSVTLFPFMLLLFAWLLYLGSPECLAVDRAYASCSMVANLITSLGFMVLGGVFLLVLPLLAWLAQNLPDVTQGTIALSLMAILALLNILFAARVAAWKGEALLQLAMTRKWFLPGLIVVFLVGAGGLIQVSSDVFADPWVSIVAVIIAWILLVFYDIIAIIAGEAVAGWMLDRGTVIAEIEGRNRE